MRWIDDSKATNIGATLAALRGYPAGSLHLILGGQAKGQDFGVLADEVRRTVVRLYVIGVDGPEIADRSGRRRTGGELRHPGRGGRAERGPRPNAGMTVLVGAGLRLLRPVHRIRPARRCLCRSGEGGGGGVPIKQRFDRLLLGAAILQMGVGLALLASASWLIATERYGRPGSYFFTWQAATALVGLGVLVICMHLRSDLLTDPKLARFGVGLAWILLAAAFVQPPVAATHRWLSIGGSFPPAVGCWRGWPSRSSPRWSSTAHDAKAGRRAGSGCWRRCVRSTAILIIAEPDLGSGALLLVVLAAMAFVAGMPIRMIAAPAVVGVVALGVAVVTSPYRLARVRAFLDPDAATAAGWQSYQSLVAIGSGGITGRGYGTGLQKLFFLPEPHTDFIFSITGEELGLIGLLGLLGLITLITWRGLRIASRLALHGSGPARLRSDLRLRRSEPDPHDRLPRSPASQGHSAAPGQLWQDRSRGHPGFGGSAAQPFTGGERMSRRVVIAGGGTGGHVFPGLAVAAELQSLGVDVHWLGARRGLEAELVPERKVPITLVDLEGIQARSPAAAARAVTLLPRAVMTAVRVLLELEPLAVMGVGGYASAAGLAAAGLLGVPTVLQEQNSIPGMTNRFLAPWADLICCGFADAVGHFPSLPAEWTGNPVRRQFFEIEDVDPHDPPRLLVLGGSQGSLFLNRVLPRALAILDR